MDNKWFHHAGIVKKAQEEEGIPYLYLPPYSPNLNPIEKM